MFCEQPESFENGPTPLRPLQKPGNNGIHGMRRYSTLFVITTLLAGVLSGCKDKPNGASNTMPDTTTQMVSTDTSTAATVSECDREQAADSRLICPHRIGAVSATTTRLSLDTMFQDVRDTTIDTGEGDFQSATIINSGARDSAILIWSDSTRTQLHFIANIGPGWRTPDGITIGSALQDIVDKVGNVKVLGLGWDYGGTLVLDGTRLANSGIFFRMQPAGATTDSAASTIRGDRPFDADDPGVKALRFFVARIDIGVD
jgi:hypothetical protein